MVRWSVPLIAASLITLAAVLKPTPKPPAVTLPTAVPVVDSAPGAPLHDYLWPAASATEDGLELLCRWRAGDLDAAMAVGRLVPDGDAHLGIVEVAADGIRVAGRRVVTLDRGVVHEGDARGALISDLYEELLEVHETLLHWEEACGTAPRERRLLLAIDPRVPYRTVQDVLFTAGQATFSEPDLLVRAAERRPPMEFRLLASTESVAITIDASGEAARSPGSLSSAAGIVLRPEPATSFADVARVMSNVAAQGGRHPALLRTDADHRPGPPMPAMDGAVSVDLDTRVTLLKTTRAPLQTKGRSSSH